VKKTGKDAGSPFLIFIFYRPSHFNFKKINNVWPQHSPNSRFLKGNLNNSSYKEKHYIRRFVLEVIEESTGKVFSSTTEVLERTTAEAVISTLVES